METEMRRNTGLRELTDDEIEQVCGGFMPALGLAVAAIGHFSARTYLTAIAGRIGLGMAVFEAAKAAGGQGGAGKTGGGGGGGGAGAGQATRMTVVRV